MNKLRKQLRERQPERSRFGQSLTEYAIILLLVGVAVVLVLNVLQPTLANTWRRFVQRAPLAPPSLGAIGPEFTPLPVTPTPSETPTETPIPTETNTPEPVTGTATFTPTPSPTPTNTPTNTPVNTPTPTNTPTNTPLPPTATPAPTNTPTSTPTNTPTPSPSPTPLPTPSPTPIPQPVYYVSSTSGGSVDGISFDDEDILRYDGTTGTWSMFFDGSDVGLSGADIDAFTILADGTIWMSFNGGESVPGVGNVDDSDIVQFTPSSTGPNTTGFFSLVFDGSDVGLTNNDEDIDAITFLPDGRLLISTTGDFNVPGASGDDEDLVAFTATNFGGNTNGTWEFYFDGGDVSLTSSNEDVGGIYVDPANNDIYITTKGGFSVSGLSGGDDDIFVCAPLSLGSFTDCDFGVAVVFDGTALGFNNEEIDGIHVEP